MHLFVASVEASVNVSALSKRSYHKQVRRPLALAAFSSWTNSLICTGIFSWDNSTRGLDASSALDWARALRALTDELGLTTIVTLYQAGNGIYDLFDKVLVLDEGEQVFYGPREQARPFMESQGFICDDAVCKPKCGRQDTC